MKADIHFFCDFDGTISEKDMIMQIMKRFIPDTSAEIIQQIQNCSLSVRQGVEQMFALLPSGLYSEVVRFAQEATQIRPGFYDFVAFCKAAKWPVHILSGGFDFFIDPVIAPVKNDLMVDYNQIDRSGEYMRVLWGETCDSECIGGCGLCKPTILRKYKHTFQKSIVIGDGVTDVKVARMANYVFARDKLAQILEEEHIPYTTFQTFHDVIATFKDQHAEVFHYVQSSIGNATSP